MNEEAYYTDAVELIHARLRSLLGEKYTYFVGDDPIAIPEASLPSVVIEPLTTVVRSSATMTDDYRETILIKVILNKKDDWGAEADSINLTKRQLSRLVQGRDPTTGYYATNSILGSLRTQLTLGDYALDNDIDIDYNVDLRPDEVITSEAYVTVMLRTRVLVPNRT